MKKTRGITTAVLALGAWGGAMAQSSVTLYGVADAGIGRITPGTIATANFGGGDSSKKTELISGSLMNNTAARWGMRGVEDLGGGLKAGFILESAVNFNSGAAGAGPSMFNREANLWLGGNWGTVTLGRDLNPTAWAIIAYDLTTAANYSVLANTYFFGGEAPRTNSMFAYKTPSFGGVTASVAYTFKADNVVSGVERSKWDANVIYANGPITAVAAANKLQGSHTNAMLGGKYRFGNFILGSTYTSAYRATGERRRGFSLGGTALMGPFTATLDLTRDTKNEWTAKKYTNAVLEGRYALSKRTFLYGAYLRFDGTNNYGLGVRHNF